MEFSWSLSESPTTLWFQYRPTKEQTLNCVVQVFFLSGWDNVTTSLEGHFPESVFRVKSSSQKTFPLNITIITSTQLCQGNKDKSSFGWPDVPATSNNCLLNLAVLKRYAGITCNSSVCKSSKTIAKSGKPTQDTLYGLYNCLISEVCGILIQDTELSPALTNWAHLMNMEKVVIVSTFLASRLHWPQTYVSEKALKTHTPIRWHKYDIGKDQLVIYFYLFFSSTAFFRVPVINAIQAKSV